MMLTGTGKSEALDLLLVEDDPEDAEFVEDLLRDSQELEISVRWRSTYEDAIESIKRKTPDVALVDYRLGAKTGIDFSNEIQQVAPQTPIILMTGAGSTRLEDRALDAGISDFLEKSELTSRNLLRCIRYAVRREESSFMERRFRLLLQSSHEMILVLDKTGVLSYVSPSIVSLLGIPRHNYLNTLVLDHIHPEDLEHVSQALERLAMGSSMRERLRFRTRNSENQWRTFDSIGVCHLDQPEIEGIVVNAWDVTTLAKTQTDLHERVKELRTLYVAREILDDQGVPLNDRLQNFVEIVPNGWHWPKSTCARLEVGEQIFVTENFKQTPWMQHVTIEPNDAETIQLSVGLLGFEPGTDAPFAPEEKQLLDALADRVVHAVRRTHLEDKLRQGQKMEAVGRLAGGIAHDFNNLLAVICGQTGLLATELQGHPNLLEDLEVIAAAAERATKLTNYLLAFSRDQILRPSIVDMRTLIEGTRKLLERALGDTIDMKVIATNTPVEFKVDVDQFERVLMNLAVNARDAMAGGGTFTLEYGVAEGGEEVELKVSDDGHGMDDATRKRVFEPFFSTKGRDRGTGLGLAMAYGFVHQSGGTIEVESKVGQGTTFTLRFPRVTENPNLSVDSDAAETTSDAPVKVSSVLVIDDEPQVARIVERILVKAGFETVVTQDAETAFAALESETQDFDAVVTDLNLPGVGGRSIVEWLNQNRPSMGIVVMSGYSQESAEIDQFMKPGTEFVQKPFSRDSLVEALQRALGLSRKN